MTCISTVPTARNSSPTANLPISGLTPNARRKQRNARRKRHYASLKNRRGRLKDCVRSSGLWAQNLRLDGFTEEALTVKKIAVLPALLTLGNGICGFVAITYASKIGMFTGAADAAQRDELNFVWAGWFIMFGMLFDMLDGYVARL